MKKVVFLILCLGTISQVSAQCLTATIGQYPDNTYVPVCNGIAASIVVDGYAGEYSLVTVTSGESYTFSSSVATDVVTISADSGATAAAFNIGSVTWIATISGDVRFYTNLNNGACGSEAFGRTRSVRCGAVPACLPPSPILTTAFITNVSATISWPASVSATTIGYDYYYSDSSVTPTEFSTPSGSVSGGITAANLMGLSTNTVYNVWVRSVCNDGNTSPWALIGTFISACDAVSSFTENFDASADFPSCWGRVGLGGSTRIQSDASATSAPNALYIYGNTDPGAIVPGKGLVAMKPVSNSNSGTHRLRFKAKAFFTAGGNLEIGCLTNSSDANSFVTLQSFTITSASDFESYTAVLGTSPTSNILAFRHTGNPAFSILIDDVVWEAIPNCVEPTAVMASNVSLTTATISWTASTSAPSSGYDYYYSTLNTPPISTTIPSGSVGAGLLSASLVGLTPSSLYYFWVRSKCTISDVSEWSNPSYIPTLCPTATVPYSENFESALLPLFPLCTSTENLGPGNSWTVVDNPGYGFTSKTLRYPFSDLNAANTWFYTNAVALTGGLNYNISYTYGNTSLSSFTEKMKVAYGTDNTASAMVNLLADYPNIVGATPTTASVNFSPLVTGNYYFGFNAYSAANQFDLLVDDISITSSLANNSFDFDSFSMFPNPLTNVLNISCTKDISTVSIYNLLGQEVFVKKLNTKQSQLDVSNLMIGAYLVKVTSQEGISKTMKVIKE